MSSSSPAGSPGRITALIIGALLALTGIGLALGGGAILVGEAALRDDDGFVSIPSTGLESSGAVLRTEVIDIRGADEWPSGDPVLLRVSVEDASQPMFVGIAPAAQVEQALEGVSNATVTQADPWSDPEYAHEGGGAIERPVTEIVDWDVHAVGPGEQQVTWKPRSGRWVVVLTNADGSEGIDARARVGIDLPFLDVFGWILLGSGIVAGLLAAALIVFGAGPGRGDGHPSGLAAPTTTVHGAGPERTHPLTLTASIDEPISRVLWLVKWLLLLPHYLVLAVLWIAVFFVTVVAWFSIVLTARYPASLFGFTRGVARWSWRVSVYGYGGLSTDRYPPFGFESAADYPAHLELVRPERLSRWLPFVKWVLVLPHVLLAGAISGGVAVSAAGDQYSQLSLLGVLALIAGGGLLFTGRLPRGVFDLLVGIQRWGWRVFAYVGLLTDEYPPFRLDMGGGEPPSGERP